jgi:hypothetical protein
MNAAFQKDNVAIFWFLADLLPTPWMKGDASKTPVMVIPGSSPATAMTEMTVK